MPRTSRLSVICVLVNALRELALGQVTFGRRGPVLFSSDRLLTCAGGRQHAAALVADAIRSFADESPLQLARLVARHLSPEREAGGDMLRVVAMSDAAALALAGISGPLMHADSLSLAADELLVAILNGDGFEPCSFHGKYRRTPEGWLRTAVASYAPVSWT